MALSVIGLHDRARAIVWDSGRFALTRENRQGLRAKCLRCGVWSLLQDLLADTTGPSFQAYYHPPCAILKVKEEIDP